MLLRLRRERSKSWQQRGSRPDWPQLVYLAVKKQRYLALHKRRQAPDLYGALQEAEAEEMR